MEDTLIHLAYAEDHPVTRQGTIQLLLPMGGVTFDIVAQNGEELIHMLRQADTLPDICMLDVQMPVMDGFAAIAAIKKLWPDMKCLAISAYDNPNYVLRMVQSGANGYLLKQCEIDDIHRALHTIHDHNYFYSEVADSRFFRMVQTEKIRLPTFSGQERKVLRLCCFDLTYQEMADVLGMTLFAVEGCRNRLFTKIGVKSKVGLALFAVQYGLVQLPLKEVSYYT